MVLDRGTIQINEGCEYGFKPLNSTEDKSDWKFKEEIVNYDYELCWTKLFWVKNWEKSKYLETFSDFSI